MAASSAECSEQADPAARLACYDAKSSPPKAESQRRNNSSEARGIYAAQLRRFFLSNGLSIEVLWYERPDPKSMVKQPAKLFPQLMIWGYIDDAFVYQMITQGDALAIAKSAGFDSLQFWSKAQGGYWTYDLSGAAIPQCDIYKRVCR
jgi:hypothetical protein